MGICKRFGWISRVESDHVSHFLFYLLASQEPSIFFLAFFNPNASVFFFIPKNVIAGSTCKAVTDLLELGVIAGYYKAYALPILRSNIYRIFNISFNIRPEYQPIIFSNYQFLSLLDAKVTF